jgi:ubiquinone/menaquinone biosynthesis C-methylase UbiE
MSAAKSMKDAYLRFRARAYDPLMLPLEASWFRAWRKETVASLSGIGLEIGIGTGLSIAHYTDNVELHAIEKLEAMAELAKKRRLRSGDRVHVRCARAEALPYDARTFDFVVGQFTLCSVDDPDQALRELARVLKPSGRLHLLEHKKSDRVGVGFAQDLFAPGWRHVAVGCRLNNDLSAQLARSPFEIVTRRVRWAGCIEQIEASIA